MSPDRIILTGFMGSGKSTVGPIVADRMGYRFIDLDSRVEQVAGRAVEVLFQERGEGVFRALETAVLSQVLGEEQVVIATGGGALISDATMAMAKDGGKVVYLRVSIDTLVDRLAGDGNRPLLQDEQGNIPERSILAERIEQIIGQRARYYEQADTVVDADDMTPPDLAAVIVRQMADQPADAG